MLRNRVQLLEAQLRKFILQYFTVELEGLAVERPPRIEFGDLAFPFPYQLAKVLRKPPRKIAEEVAENFEPPEGIRHVEAAGGGYVNVFFERSSFFRDLYHDLQKSGHGDSSDNSPKIIVEHTNINPNKAAHIGHLRNAVLGDTFVRHLRAVRRWVEVQNYIDNTGVQVADVVVGFHYIRHLSLDEVARIAEPFDYYCWDLYAEVSEWYEEDESRLELRQSTLKAIEEGNSELSLLGEHISNRIVKAHLKTMNRLDVRYDLLPRESEIMHLRFWDEAFQMLKNRQAIHIAEKGPNEGCWVMELPGENGQPDETKIIVRSNGTVTYVGKDIAYQLWKFGLLRRTFHYQLLEWNGHGGSVWVTTTEASRGEPDFGGADFVYNVIDIRQSYLQRVVVQGLKSLGFDREADRSIHFSYEMVALSPACCDELNIELSDEDRNRPYVEVSGRKGLGVKADDLIDKLIEKSLCEVNQRQPDLSEEARTEIARQIAVGALRYFMLKYTRNAVIAFDFSEALSFEGETGPYLQYSVVRANNIFKKVKQRLSGWDEESWRKDAANHCFPEQFFEDDEIWNLILQIARIEDAVYQSIDSLELSQTARHAFTLAQQFNLFYHRYHILSEEDELRRDFYLAIADSARQGLLRLTDLTGIQVPERM